MKDRKCGSCNLCCEVFKIEETGKAQGQKCKHLKAGCNGCTIYEKRPNQCRSFACLWLQGIGAASMRPDRSGVVLTTPGGMMVHGHASSFEKIKPAARRFLDSMTDRAVVVLVAGDRRELIGGPSRLINEIMGKAAS
jgi:hypothetical protein